MTKPTTATETRGAASRRQAFGLMLGAGGWLPQALAAADGGAPVRLALSESMLGGVNPNDARAAMTVWTKRMFEDMNIVLDPKLFSTRQEIHDRARRGQLDAMVLNAVEYRPIADLLDASQLVAPGGAAGMEQYLILAKRNGGIRQLSDLKGRRLNMLKAPKMCVADAWLSTLLEERHYGPAEQFFGSVVTDAKFSRVVLPVFFGQADACLTTKRGFDTMCELNPQVARDLIAIASSPAMVLVFCIFRKNYISVNREKLIKALIKSVSTLLTTEAGRQLATLFQFDELAIRDAGCLASVLGVLDAADRANGKPVAGSQKG